MHTHTPTASVAGDVTNRESLVSRPSVGDNNSYISDTEVIGMMGNSAMGVGNNAFGPNMFPRNGQVMQVFPESGQQVSVSTHGGIPAASHSTYVPVVHALNWGLAHCNETLMQGTNRRHK